MQNLIGFPEKQLQEILSGWQEKPYRTCQVLTWVYHHGIRDFNLMTNLSKNLRKRLKEFFYFSLPQAQKNTPFRAFLGGLVLALIFCSFQAKKSEEISE